MTDHNLPISALRPGGDPHPLPPEPVDLVWDSYDYEGEPRVSNIGGGLIFAPELVNIRTCDRCGAQLVTPQFLKLHLEEKHPSADE